MTSPSIKKGFKGRWKMNLSHYPSKSNPEKIITIYVLHHLSFTSSHLFSNLCCDPLYYSFLRIHSKQNKCALNVEALKIKNYDLPNESTIWPTSNKKVPNTIYLPQKDRHTS